MGFTASTIKWPELESNQRHKDFQSSALPPELSGRIHDIHTNDPKIQDFVYSIDAEESICSATFLSTELSLRLSGSYTTL